MIAPLRTPLPAAPHSTVARSLFSKAGGLVGKTLAASALTVIFNQAIKAWGITEALSQWMGATLRAYVSASVLVWGVAAIAAVAASILAWVYVAPRFRGLPARPQHDNMIPLIRVRSLCADSGFVLERFGPLQNNGYALEGALKSAAANGTLQVKGRPYHGPVGDNDPLVGIPADHFLTYGFRHGDIEGVRENKHTRTANLDMLARDTPLQGIEGVTYYDIYVSENETRRILSDVRQGLIW